MQTKSNPCLNQDQTALCQGLSQALPRIRSDWNQDLNLDNEIISTPFIMHHCLAADHGTNLASSRALCCWLELFENSKKTLLLLNTGNQWLHRRFYSFNSVAVNCVARIPFHQCGSAFQTKDENLSHHLLFTDTARMNEPSTLMSSALWNSLQVY